MNSENRLDNEYEFNYNDPNAKGNRDELLETSSHSEWEDLPCDDDEIED